MSLIGLGLPLYLFVYQLLCVCVCVNVCKGAYMLGARVHAGIYVHVCIRQYTTSSVIPQMWDDTFFMEEGPLSDWKPVKQVRTAGHQIPEVTVSVSLVLGS